MDLTQLLGRWLIMFSAALMLAGLLLVFGSKLPFVGFLGRLPGDLSFGGESFRVYVPLGTSILLSSLLTVALSLFGRLFR